VPADDLAEGVRVAGDVPREQIFVAAIVDDARLRTVGWLPLGW
jgi:hypothetical protein